MIPDTYTHINAYLQPVQLYAIISVARSEREEKNCRKIWKAMLQYNYLCIEMWRKGKLHINLLIFNFLSLFRRMCAYTHSISFPRLPSFESRKKSSPQYGGMKIDYTHFDMDLIRCSGIASICTWKVYLHTVPPAWVETNECVRMCNHHVCIEMGKFYCYKSDRIR